MVTRILNEIERYGRRNGLKPCETNRTSTWPRIKELWAELDAERAR